jgi:hypothetical protein
LTFITEIPAGYTNAQKEKGKKRKAKDKETTLQEKTTI